jgi:hypothetical protein
MIEYPGISNTEVGNNFERFSNWVSLIEGSAAADVPYEFCIVYSHDEYKCDMRRREGKVESWKNKREQLGRERGVGLAECGIYLGVFIRFNPKGINGREWFLSSCVDLVYPITMSSIIPVAILAGVWYHLARQGITTTTVW